MNIAYMAKSKWTALLDAIRTKGGTSASMTVDQAITAVENIPQGGGGGEELDSFIERTVSTVNNSTVSNVGAYAFANCKSLINATFQNATVVDNYAFSACTSLQTVSFPSAVSFKYSVFDMCLSLNDVYAPQLTSFDQNCFRSCQNLLSVSFPHVLYVTSYAFQNCTSLQSAVFPEVIGIESDSFKNCQNLSMASFDSLSYIRGTAFASCYNLLSLYLMGSSVAWLIAYTAFNSTPISSYTTSTGGVYGSIYVPSSLYSRYLSASNWSRFSSRFVSM